MPPRLHIVGAGLAGLACAVRAAEAGIPVSLYEAAAQAGGRCRSYHDDVLGRDIDNGNHLLLSGNAAAMAYARLIGAADRFAGPAAADFPFLDLATGERWTVRLNDGRIPWWMLNPGKRVKGTRLRDYLSAARLLAAGPDATVADCVNRASPLYARFWEPLTVAVLNAKPEDAAARLLIPVLTRTFLKGGVYCRPMVARTGLSDSLIEPALAFLERHGVTIAFHHRLKNVERTAAAVTGLDFAERQIALGTNDGVVLALPPAMTKELLPDVPAPADASPIVNAHFRLDRPAAGPNGNPILGLIGGAAQWLFFRDDIISVTVSAADDLVPAPAEDIAARLWRDVAIAIGAKDAPIPTNRIVKEKRATFAQTPAALNLRPTTKTSLRNLALAGDWTATGLPATIEGAVTSGFAAADYMLAAWPLTASDPNRRTASLNREAAVERRASAA